MKKIYIGTNTKMYMTIKEHMEFVKKLEKATMDIGRENLELFVIPSYTSIGPCNKIIDNDLISIGAQNMNWEDKGAYTGEISPLMLKEVGANIIELGHSERRHIFGEDDITINKKVVASLSHGFKTLLCIGETEAQKNNRDTEKILNIQINVGLDGVDNKDIEKILIAYEPVWAIGEKGMPPNIEYVDKIHEVIRNILIKKFGIRAKEIPILYGGSVNRENFESLILIKQVNGLFIGRSAWDIDNFIYIIKKIAKLRK